MTAYDALSTVAYEPGQALAEWCAQAPASGFERQVRADLAALMAASRALRECSLDVAQALDDAAKKLQVESADTAGGYHEDPWLDGYRVGYGHAQVRLSAALREIVASIRIRSREGA